MRLAFTVIAVSVLLAGVMAMASAEDALDLSTLNKKPTIDAVSLPQVSPNMPSIAPTALSGNEDKNVLDLSTLGKKAARSSVASTTIQSSNPITLTPMFSIKNANMTVKAATVFTLPQAISANPSVYTPAIAIFGGA
jgi:hypothetical protein